MTGAAAALVNLVASALAAIATAVLAVFAIRQWRAMKQNNELVRERWEREDLIRAEENKPKAAFDFPHQVCDKNASPLELTCTNLGSVNFLVVGMLVTPSKGEPKRIPFNPEEYFVVLVGEKKRVDLGRLRNINTLGSCGDVVGIGLILQGPSGEIETKSHRCRISYSPDARYIVQC